ncbi:hypothetical protein ABT173_43200 [Streptomyces sp. NPDC001795]|uniref:hypothetical protein n=1 Tax=Streptomyces sp. NPDC001795 TaxID=3154525 RepID=UPI00332C2530
MIEPVFTPWRASRTGPCKLLLDDMAAAHPKVTKVWAEGSDQSSIFNHGAGLGSDVEVVQRPQAKAFQPLPKRW